jgi:hypothetical protein
MIWLRFDGILVAAGALIFAGLLSCSSDDTGGTSGSGGGGASPSSSTMSSTAAAGGGMGGSASTGGGMGGGTSVDTWSNYAQGFFATYCVECHNPSDALRDYNLIADVQADSAEIRCGVAATQLSGCTGFPAPKQFPISNATNSNPKPSDAERTRIVAWIEAGLRQ